MNTYQSNHKSSNYEIDDTVIDSLEQFPFIVYVSSEKVTYRSLHGGGPTLNTVVLQWLEKYVGSRENNNWIWFSVSRTDAEFGFSNKEDATYFKLVWT